MKTVYLIACGQDKARTTKPARYLYQGTLFAAAAAESTGCEWAILSAKHGLVRPDDVLEPYNQTLRSMKREAKQEWSRKTKAQIVSRWPEAEFVCFAPELYSHALDGLKAEFPVRGLGIGYQMQYFTKLAEKNNQRGLSL